MLMASSLLGVAGAFALSPARAINQYSREAWQTENGLPQNSAATIVQTRDGYLWFGTQEGLVRFDGARFFVFDRTNTPAMTNNHVAALLEARDGSVWIGTFGGGLLRMERGEFQAYTAQNGLASDSVTAIAQDRSGRLWIGTSGSGLNRFEGGRFARYTVAEGLPSDLVRCLQADPAGGIWIGTAAGLARFRDGKLESFGPREGLASVTITGLALDREGRLWIGTTEGLASFKERRFMRYTRGDGLLDDGVRSVLTDREGSLWVGSDGGLSRLRDGRFESFTREDGLTGSSVTALLEDREGSLWVGTDGGGINRFAEGKVVTYTVRNGLSSDVVYTITGAGRNGLWVGTYGGEINRLEGDRFREVREAHPPGPASRIRALHEDRRGRLWIGTERGLFRFADDRVTAYRGKEGSPDGAVRVIGEDRQGRIWVGTDGGGLVRLGDGAPALFTEEHGLGSNEIRAILEDRSGALWVGTYGGLSRFEGGRFLTYSTVHGLAHNMVRCLLEDSEGTLWIGTYGGGLSRLKDGKFTAYTTKHGLFSDVIYGILDDDRGHLWMSCNRGLFRVAKRELNDVASGKAPSLRSVSYDEADGMRSRECNGGSPGGWKTPEGRLWFPTLKGVVSVDPGRLPVNVTRPPVVLEDVIVDGDRFDPARPARLPPHRQRIEFRFTALSFVAPQKVRFSYRLEGFDAAWIDAGASRTASYTRLPPGRYAFRVTACNNDGVWNDTGASFDFELRPTFYETPWFFAGCGLGLLAAGGGLYRWRIRRLEGREKLLQQRIQEALAQVKVLSGLLPICAGCKKIRDDQGYWRHVEVYIREHTEATFSHGLCPPCVRRLYPEIADRVLTPHPEDEG